MSYWFFVFNTLWVLLLSSPTVTANDEHSEHHEHHESGQAHVHGTAELFVVLEGNQLSIQLHSPAVNLLGFEGHAETTEQQSLLNDVRQSLANTKTLFQFENDLCQLKNHSADFTSVTKKNDHEEHSEHSDIESHYLFHCEQTDKLYSLTTQLTNRFPAIHSLQVQWIVKGRQGAITLDNSQHQVFFR
ncbi:Uncharacterised protein [Zhongshania aliphaticivorans]|uniref:DUF2796 domain-containing protein n=1 Tax=Zhongshania aliphaticivorans TaxID=1470434 RepID=A0A5S9NJE5_9GAMM|nr:DUF2796 domain-containing protein [Zhongshania aliphaticivorans]CAA0089997.1 Uncharacterised protein [Zhongshania aliphaticivorans]CAA0097197.1 Uncharacterised protein [Zhongshania aliphaticivorans]